ncbi:MAG: glycosyl transferase family protein [Candidatus Competibacterales bacterium]
MTPHPFAPFVAALGRGKKASRALTLEEAEAAMAMILEDRVEDVQLGAFLMLLRVKEESGDEVAGFVRAIRARCGAPADFPAVDLDWSSYAGKRRHLPWLLLAAQLLAHNGVRVLMHGAEGHTAGRIYLKDALEYLGLPVAADYGAAAEGLRAHHFAYLPLEAISPRLKALIELRPLFGLRSPVHTVARMINPARAAASFQGIFHPGYLAIHQAAAVALQDPRVVVIRGEGGEAERNPDVDCVVHAALGGQAVTETWPALFARRHIKPAALDLADLARVWRGEHDDEYGAAAVVATAALGLWATGRVASPEAAQAQAQAWWEARPRGALLARVA